MNIRDAVEAFLLDHKARGSRPRTLDWHRQVLLPVLRPWLDEDLSALTVFTVNKALDRDVMPNTRANYERSLRAFTNWLLGVDLLTRDPFKGKRRAKQEYKPKRTLTHAEIQALFKAGRADPRWRYRNAALLALFLDTGLRASEVARLKLGDVDWATGYLQVEGKTGNATVACSGQTLRMLRRYTSHERKATDPHLFVYAGQPLTQPSLTRWAARLGERAGIGKIGCHTFRRTFATICTPIDSRGFVVALPSAEGAWFEADAARLAETSRERPVWSDMTRQGEAAAGEGVLGALPLAVVSRSVTERVERMRAWGMTAATTEGVAALCAVWKAIQADYARSFTRGAFVVALNSFHHVHFDSPEKW